MQRKDTSIKTIPAFKPIPSADGTTPDSTPEKRSPLSLAPISKAEVKLERIKNRAEKKHKVSPMSGDGEDSAKSDANLSSSGAKFTTANFTETVVTQSSGPLFAVEKGRKGKKSSGSIYSLSSDSEQVNSDTNGRGKEDNDDSNCHDSDSDKDDTSDGEVTQSPKPLCGTLASSPSQGITFKSVYESFMNGNRRDSSLDSALLTSAGGKKARIEKPEKKKLRKISNAK